MLCYMLFVCVSIAQAALAQESAPTVPVIHVQQLDPTLPMENFKGKNVKVHNVQELDKNSLNLPSRAEREKLFKASDLTTQVASWDEMDRDLLVVRARDYPIDRLVSSYPKIPKVKLEKLKSIQQVTP